MTVQANESTPLGGMVCLSYWRDGRCGEAYPHTWRFLLKTVKDSPTFGPLVAETIEKKAYSETSWSELPAQLPGSSTLKVRLTEECQLSVAACRDDSTTIYSSYIKQCSLYFRHVGNIEGCPYCRCIILPLAVPHLFLNHRNMRYLNLNTKS